MRPNAAMLSLSLLLLPLTGGLARADCQAPAAPAVAAGVAAPLQNYAGIQSSDGILDVWCRLQTQLRGRYTVDILFPLVDSGNAEGTHRSFEVTFDGRPSQDKMVLAQFIQSLLPVGKASYKDERGMAFPKVLANVVRPTARTTSNGEPMAFPPEFGGANQLAIWEPVALRVKPVDVMGSQFKLAVFFRPSVARWLEEMLGQHETFELQGARERVLPAGDENNCPEHIPSCSVYLPYETLPLQTAWTVSSVKLSTEGERLSNLTLNLFNALAASNKTYLEGNSVADGHFDATAGNADLTATDGIHTLTARAKGDDDGHTGTTAILMDWHENNQNPDAYARRMQKWAEDVRQTLVLRYSGVAGKTR